MNIINNKIYASLLALLMSMSIAAASDKIHVEAISEFSTAHPAQKIDVRVIEDNSLGSYTLKEGDIIHCNVVKVTDPKRGKRAASFAVCPTSYTSDNETKEINEKYSGKYATKIISKKELKNVDAAKLGKKAAISVGNHFVKGVAPAISLAEGMIKNEDGNRIESGVKKVYKDSPLSYVEKGKELNINPNDKFYLIFKPTNGSYNNDIDVDNDEESNNE